MGRVMGSFKNRTSRGNLRHAVRAVLAQDEFPLSNRDLAFLLRAAGSSKDLVGSVADRVASLDRHNAVEDDGSIALVCHNMIDAGARCRLATIGLLGFALLLKRGVPPSTDSYNSLLNVACRASEPAWVTPILHRMKETSSPKTTRTYALAMRALTCRGRDGVVPNIAFEREFAEYVRKEGPFDFSDKNHSNRDDAKLRGSTTSNEFMKRVIRNKIETWRDRSDEVETRLSPNTSARERRLVHIICRELEGVTSESRGSASNRVLAISRVRTRNTETEDSTPHAASKLPTTTRTDGYDDDDDDDDDDDGVSLNDWNPTALVTRNGKGRQISNRSGRTISRKKRLHESIFAMAIAHHREDTTKVAQLRVESGVRHPGRETQHALLLSRAHAGDVEGALAIIEARADVANGIEHFTAAIVSCKSRGDIDVALDLLQKAYNVTPKPTQNKLRRCLNATIAVAECAGRWDIVMDLQMLWPSRFVSPGKERTAVEILAKPPKARSLPSKTLR
eukprot:g4690.t1